MDGKSPATRWLGPAFLAGVVVVWALPVVAEEPSPAAGRYAIQPDADGFVRLDTETGAASHCSRKAGVWECQPLTDAPSAPDPRIDALTAEVKTLSERIDALSARLDALVVNRPAASPGTPSSDLDFAETLMQRFFGMVREMKRESVAKTP